MIRLLKTALLVLLLALLPLRDIAAARAGLCAAAQPGAAQLAAPQYPADHDHGRSGCIACAEHCSGASAIVPLDGMPLPPPGSRDRIALGHRFATAFVAEHPDRPPLVC